MILYTFMSSYQLLECIENKLLLHKGEDAILMLYPFALDKFPHYRQLIDFGIFSDAFVFESGRINYKSEKLVDDIERVLVECLPISIDEVNEFIVFGVHMPISIYLIENGIKFETGEDGSGAYSRPELLYEIEKSSFLPKFEVMDHYGLYNLQTIAYENIAKIYINEAGQREGYLTRNELENFNLSENFALIDRENRKNILNFFHCPQNIKYGNNSFLLLTQQFANLNQIDFEGQIMIYKIFVDLFVGDANLIIKPHPDDVLFYDTLFPDAQIIKEKFPSELLPYVGEKLPDTVGTITSSSIHMFSKLNVKKIQFHVD